MQGIGYKANRISTIVDKSASTSMSQDGYKANRISTIVDEAYLCENAVGL